jgi:hypothetical protein
MVDLGAPHLMLGDQRPRIGCEQEVEATRSGSWLKQAPDRCEVAESAVRDSYVEVGIGNKGRHLPSLGPASR